MEWHHETGEILGSLTESKATFIKELCECQNGGSWWFNTSKIEIVLFIAEIVKQFLTKYQTDK